MDKKNNIENFIKERLEFQEFNFRESDWSMLEKRLDETGLSSPGLNLLNGKSILILGLSIIAAFVLGWYARDIILQNKENIKFQIDRERNETEKIQSFENREKAASKDNGKIESTIVNNKTSTDNIKANQTNLDSYKTKTTDYKDRLPEKKVSRLQPSKISKDEKEVFLKGSFEAKSDIHQYSALSETYDNEADFNLNGSLPIFDSLNATEMEKGLTVLEENENIGIIKPLPSIIGDKETLLSTDISAFEVRNEINNKISPNDIEHTRFIEKWSIGLSITPDFNSVGLQSEKTLTAQIGGHLFFHLTSRWSISAGVNYNNKKYNTTAENYSPGEDYWDRATDGMLPENINGSCRVLDLPLMASYSFFQRDYFSLKASAGLSTYILQDEYYYFEFSTYYQGSTYGWETENNTMAPFSVGNLNLGIEVRTGIRTSLLLEPYLQIPLQDIGWGNIRLYSTGVHAMIKYRLWNL